MVLFFDEGRQVKNDILWWGVINSSMSQWVWNEFSWWNNIKWYIKWHEMHVMHDMRAMYAMRATWNDVKCNMKWCAMQFFDFGYIQRDVTLIFNFDHNLIILFLISLRIWASVLMWNWFNRMSKIRIYRLPLLTIHFARERNGMSESGERKWNGMSELINVW